MRDNDNKEFEERADFIENEDLINWTVQNDFFLKVHEKILQRGAKLIVGPRGTGKTHQMKFAYHICLNNEDKPLAIYTSFTKYFHLEPLLSKKSNAITIFHTWVLGKIILSCYQLINDLKIEWYKSDSILNQEILSQEKLEKFISEIEKGIYQEWHDEILNDLTLNRVINFIEWLIKKTKRKRAILLLDDAALTLTPEYLINFFDVFRSLKTIRIAPKASVYPGTTIYGPRFHVGHDAEKIPLWLHFIEVGHEDYSEFMAEIINKRALDIENIDQDIIEIFKYAAFGIPRYFINLLRSYKNNPKKPFNQRFNHVINEQFQFIKLEFLSFSKKLPQYDNIINTGWKLHEKMIEILTAENQKMIQSTENQLLFSIKKENILEQDRMFQFLIEAGFLYEMEENKGGSNIEYRRYVPHFLFLIQKRAFSTSQGFKASEVIRFIKRKAKKHAIRRELSKVLDSQEINLNLNLYPCQKCNAERLTEQQKFCHNCGKELTRQSTFDECMEITIDKLPLTKFQKDTIDKETDLHKLKDFLVIQSPATELRKAKGIGEKKADKIYKIAIDRIEEFLS
jgi:hypothetical protein